MGREAWWRAARQRGYGAGGEGSGWYDILVPILELGLGLGLVVMVAVVVVLLGLAALEAVAVAVRYAGGGMVSGYARTEQRVRQRLPIISAARLLQKHCQWRCIAAPMRCNDGLRVNPALCDVMQRAITHHGIV